MNEIKLYSPTSIARPSREQGALVLFLQRMVNRVVVGTVRYGAINKSKGYMTRMGKELDAYRAKGNAEQLYNIAVYAFLETVAPEHKKHHFDATAVSVTRKTSSERKDGRA